MKKSQLSLFSFIAVAFASIFVYQNCSQQGFSTVRFSSTTGKLTGMDANGVIQGEITLKDCDVNPCPSEIPVSFETQDGGEDAGQTTAVNQMDDGNDGNGNGDGGNDGDGDGDSGGDTEVYTFTFTIPDKFKCESIKVIVTDPRSGSASQLPIDDSFVMWGGDPSCGFQVTPIITVDDVKQDGPVISIEGKCTSIPQGVNVSGDVMGVDNNIHCDGGKYQYCALLSEPKSNLNVTIQQMINGQISQQQVPFSLMVPPMVLVVVDTMVINGRNIKVNGRCTDGAKLTFNIYNNDVGKVDCVDGKFMFDKPVLVNTTPRILYITQTTPFGITKTIAVDVDQTSKPNCEITSQVSDNFCSDSSGNISGTCQAGLPVLVYVDDVLQGVAYCSDSGSFQANHVIINNQSDDKSSKVTIKQNAGRGASTTCTDDVMMSSF